MQVTMWRHAYRADSDELIGYVVGAILDDTVPELGRRWGSYLQ